MSNLVDHSGVQSQPENWGQAQKVQVVPTQSVPVKQAPVQNNVQNGAQSDSPKFEEHTTKLSVYFNGKLRDMNSKVLSKTISPANVTDVFKPRGAFAIHADSTASAAPKVDLSKVIITGMSVTSTCNKFPFAVKFDFPGQGGVANSYDMSGQAFPLMLYPGETNRGISHTLFSAKDVLNDPLLKKYGHADINDMRSKIQIINVHGGQKMALVPRNHEALKLIALNPQRFGAYPTEADIFEKNMFKMSPKQISAAIDEMQASVLSRFNFTDLSKFKVSMFREDERDFNDLSNSEWDHMEEADKAMSMEKVLSAGFDLHLTWTCPQSAPQPQAVNTQQQSHQNGVNPSVEAYNTFQNASKIPASSPRTQNS